MSNSEENDSSNNETPQTGEEQFNNNNNTQLKETHEVRRYPYLDNLFSQAGFMPGSHFTNKYEIHPMPSLIPSRPLDVDTQSEEDILSEESEEDILSEESEESEEENKTTQEDSPKSLWQKVCDLAKKVYELSNLFFGGGKQENSNQEGYFSWFRNLFCNSTTDLSDAPNKTLLQQFTSFFTWGSPKQPDDKKDTPRTPPTHVKEARMALFIDDNNDDDDYYTIDDVQPTPTLCSRLGSAFTWVTNDLPWSFYNGLQRTVCLI